MSSVQQESIENLSTIQRFGNLAMMLDMIAQEDLPYTVEIEDSVTGTYTWVRIRTQSESAHVHSGAQWVIQRRREGKTTCRFLGGWRFFFGAKTKNYRNQQEATRSLIHTARTTI